MANTGGNLQLEIFQEGTKGWGQGVNRNMSKIDSKMILLHTQAKDKATDIEKVVASYSADILSLVEEASADYVTKAETLKASIVAELKDYIDELIGDHLTRALDNQAAVQASITTLQTQLNALEDIITGEFNSIESTINERFSGLSSDLSAKYSSVIVMRDQLLTTIAGIAEKLDTHLADRTNPHRVTFEDAGGSAALRYISDTDKDKRYL